MTGFVPIADAGAQRRILLLRTIALVLFAIGVGWTDCVLVATAVAIAATSHESARNARAPRDGWRIACDCWLTTLIYMGVGLLLALMIVLTGFDHWGSSAAPLPRLIVLGLAAGSAIVLATLDRHRIGLVSLGAVTVGAVALIGWNSTATGCVVAVLVIVGLMARAWHLARVVAPFTLRNDQRY